MGDHRPRKGMATRLADAEARASALAVDLDHSVARARRLQSLTSGLLRALTPAQVAGVVINDGLEAIRAEAGVLVSVSWEDRKCRLVGGAGFPDEVLSAWREFDLDAPTPIRTAILTGEPVWLPDRASRDREFPALSKSVSEPLYSSWVVLPLVVRDRALGALALCYAEEGERPEAERTFMLLLAQQCAQGLERARLYEAERSARVKAEFAERRVAFLAEASARLGASLDMRITLSSVARLIVPEFADWVVLRALGARGRPDIAVAAHRDPALTARLRQWEDTNAPAPTDGSGAAAALYEGRSELLEEMTPTRTAREARNAIHRILLRDLDTRSRLSVPVRVRNRVLGVVVLGASAVGRRYTGADLALAEDLAARIAQAIDNAQLYESALAASQAKSNFLAVMSHELRTPLNAILGYADLILMGVPQPVGERTRHQVERMRDAGGRLLRLVEEVLSFARLEADREVVHVQPTQVAEVLGDTLSLLEPIAAAKGLHLTVAAPDLDLTLQTDAWKLRHVLSNLLSNAVKFTETGRVDLRVKPDGNRVVFEVSDTGIGISEEHIERIFDPFWQVEQSATRRYEGTGLGLGVARELTRLLGGEIVAESRPGAGSTFRVSIPRTYTQRRDASVA